MFPAVRDESGVASPIVTTLPQPPVLIMSSMTARTRISGCVTREGLTNGPPRRPIRNAGSQGE